jgi:hypothetical protein
MFRTKQWDRWIYPLAKEADEAFCSLVAAELRSSGVYSDYMSELVHAGKYREVVLEKIPKDLDLVDYRGATLIQALFSKNGDLDLGFNPLKAAVEAAIAAELQCGRVNEYFGQTCPYGGVVMAIALARRKIKKVLGKVPTLDSLRFHFGPGASTTIKRADACFENKLDAQMVCSEEMLPVVDQVLREFPAWTSYHSAEMAGLDVRLGDDNHLRVASCNIVVEPARLIFVEKNAKTHRPICVEPLLNGFMQLGVGKYLKERLRVHAKQDLGDQTRNQILARLGSQTGRIATLDLSSASDTLAFSVVFDLLPEEWVNLLASFRTGHMVYGGREYELEKFSSMGNGYTFELESLIFWALSSACTELSGEDQSYVSVYGDDIIVPVKAVDLLMATLTWCGFNLNREKSFWTGSFRESCGADWLDGEAVRPVYKKTCLTPQWLAVFHNWAWHRGYIDSLCAIAKSFIPKDLQLYGPPGYGDGHLLGPWKTTRLPRHERRRGYEGCRFDTFREIPRTVETVPEVAALTGIYDLYANPSDWWECRGSRTPGITPGSACVERHSIYTFAKRVSRW